MILLLACALPDTSCDCPQGVEGFGVQRGEACLCLPKAEATPEPTGAAELQVQGDAPIDWAEVDGLLAEGPVILRFSGQRSEDLLVERSDTGPHRLVLDGGAQRAVVPSVRTSYEEVAVHRVTVQRFEITGGDDKGVYWRGGDEVLIEDNLVHHVGGSPAISLEYANRSGLPSSGFTVRNNHVFAQRGEGIYIGGSEGEDQDAHQGLLIERNLVHDCVSRLDTRNDGINVKDRIAEVVVRENLVLRTDWGIEVASPGWYDRNVVLDTEREGFQVSDGFAPIDSMAFQDNLVIAPGHDGFHLSSDSRSDELVVEGLVVDRAAQAGVLVGGEGAFELRLEGVHVQDSTVGLDGWAPWAEAQVLSCSLVGNAEAVDRLFDGQVCEEAERIDLGEPAGPDAVFFTEDDPVEALRP